LTSLATGFRAGVFAGAAFFVTRRTMRALGALGAARLVAFLATRLAAGFADFAAFLPFGADLRAVALRAALRAATPVRLGLALAAERFGAAPERRRAGAFRFAIRVSSRTLTAAVKSRKV
jgi:hypothetical protein